ncbi:hypothetical protein FACS189419_05010 [Planctomycetales bacterium]|nr:hypothetical protein FACS189419_05010 [Planctomycetales bacterium]
MNELDELVAKYCSALSEAEEAIKFAEYSIDTLSSSENEECCSVGSPNGVVIPAVNELRYSARHFSDAIFGKPGKNRLEEMDKAYRHCVRARYDALRAVALFLVRDFRKFVDDYRLIDTFEQEVNDFDAHCIFVESTIKALSKEPKSSPEDFSELQGQIEKLNHIYLQTKGHRGKLNKILAEMQTHSNSSNRQWWISLIVGIVGIFVGLFLGKCF